MCEQCLTNPIYFGEPLEGFILARARRQGNDWNIGDWGLIECNDPSYTWSYTPTPNPCWGMTSDEEDAWAEAQDPDSPEYKRWNTIPGKFAKQFDDCGPMGGYELIKAAIDKGYDRKIHGHFQYWLFDYLAEYLKTATPEPDDVNCFPTRDELYPMDTTITGDVHSMEPPMDQW